MNELLIEFLGGFTKTNQWSAILPEIMLGVLALALLGWKISDGARRGRAPTMPNPRIPQTVRPPNGATMTPPSDSPSSAMPSANMP